MTTVHQHKKQGHRITPVSTQKRTVYSEGQRHATLGRLTTRCPAVLRDYLRFAASNPSLRYRTLTHMLTVCLVDFLAELSSPGESDIVWARGRGAHAGTVLVHVNTERVEPKDGTLDALMPMDGVELAVQAMSAAKAHGVNMSSFTLTFLFWVATNKHPAPNARLKRSVAGAKSGCFA